jgi:GNAT superfamily N-acetyltransferase
MSIELVPASKDHFRDLSRICHLAFNALHTRHSVAPDVPTEEVGRLIIGGVLNRPDYVGVTAMENGRVVGSNFICLADEVCGVGPITVDPTIQSKGVGRALMRWVIDEARKRRGGGAKVRLFQEALNTTSLSLYTSLGFQWREAAALMSPAPAEAEDPGVRPMTEADVDAVDVLCVKHHGFSRLNDIRQLLAMQLPAFVMERGGRVVAYKIATLFGHAAAETDDALLSLCSQLARMLPPPVAVTIVPLGQAELFRRALGRGYRTVKVVNYMSLDAWDRFPGPAMPSIQA